MTIEYCNPETKVADLSRDCLRERISGLLANHSELEQNFLDFTVQNHGATLAKEHFVDVAGVEHRLGRLTNFVRDESDLSGERIPDWEDPRYDFRLKFSVFFLDSVSNISEGMGEYLLPIGILYHGSNHPDDMKVTHANTLALDMSSPGIPSVVVWYNDKGIDQVLWAEREGLMSLDHSRMTTRIADSFEQFLKMVS